MNLLENGGRTWWTPRRLMAAKVIVIGILTLLLMIPMVMISDLVNERERTASEAVEEVGERWSLPLATRRRIRSHGARP